MTRSSSSTSSSEPAAGEELPPDVGIPEPGAATWSGIARVVGWMLAWLMVFDVTAGYAFRPPADPRVEPSRMQSYFEYGRSIEGKLRAMVTAEDETSAPIANAGWLGEEAKLGALTEATAPDRILVAAYGQSFTQKMLAQAQELDRRIEIRFMGGPSAPLSHSFKMQDLDRHAHTGRVVLVGILASSLPFLVTLTPMIWGFEAPTPFTYPRYRLENDELHETEPPITDLAGLRGALGDLQAFRVFRATLKANDPGFSAFLFDEDVLDASVLGRLVRRSLGHKHQTEFIDRYHSSAGFVNRDGLLDVARALLIEFARGVRADGRVPFVVLFENRGYAGHLVDALGTTLEANDIPYVSSGNTAPATNRGNFVADGHFTAEANRRIAEAFVKELRVAVP